MNKQINVNALLVIHKRNREVFPSEIPLVEMSMETAHVLMNNYMVRHGDGQYIEMTPMEFQAAIMIRSVEM